MDKDTRLLPTPGQWTVEYGAVYSIKGPRLLLADRSDDGVTWPTERDANIKLAADAVNFARSIARLTTQDECQTDTEDTINTLDDLIVSARKITGEN